MLEKRSGTIAGKLVNLSGRQRMLSQRIAKIYLLETWGLASEQQPGHAGQDQVAVIVCTNTIDARGQQA